MAFVTIVTVTLSDSICSNVTAARTDLTKRRIILSICAFLQALVVANLDDFLASQLNVCCCFGSSLSSWLADLLHWSTTTSFMYQSAPFVIMFRLMYFLTRQRPVAGMPTLPTAFLSSLHISSSINGYVWYAVFKILGKRWASIDLSPSFYSIMFVHCGAKIARSCVDCVLFSLFPGIDPRFSPWPRWGGQSTTQR